MSFREPTEGECAASIGGYLVAKGVDDGVFRTLIQYLPTSSLSRLGLLCAPFQDRDGEWTRVTDTDLRANVLAFLLGRQMPTDEVRDLMRVLTPNDFWRIGCFASGDFASAQKGRFVVQSSGGSHAASKGSQKKRRFRHGRKLEKRIRAIYASNGGSRRRVVSHCMIEFGWPRDYAYIATNHLFGQNEGATE